jgi:MFS family permease
LKKPRIFYGYWVLAACFVMNILSAGCGPISFSFFVTSLEKSLEWSRTEIMTAFTIFFICSAISGPFAGRLVHHYGARKVISIGILVACSGYALLSQTSQHWHFYIGYALVGIAVASTGPVITTLVISNWFIRRRGMAIGALSTGPGTAGLLFTPLVIIYLLPNLGWSNTYLIYAAVSGVIGIPLAALVIRTGPADMKLLADGKATFESAGINTDTAITTRGVSFGNAVTTQAFWLVGFAILFVSTHMGVMQSQVPHLEDLGFSPGIVASTMSIVAVTSAMGPLLFGWLSDRIKVKSTAIISIALITISIVILVQVTASTPSWFIWIYAVLLGLGVGGWMPTMSLLTSTNFGLLAYGTIYGALNAFQSIGAAIAPIFSGYFYDTRGTFELAFILTAVLVALGIPVIVAIRRPKLNAVGSV